MLSNDGKLDALVKRAMEAFNALTPEQQQAHRREQAISWAFGESLLSSLERGEPISEDEATIVKQRIADIYDRRRAEQKDISEP